MKKYIYTFMLFACGALLLSNSAGRGSVSGQGAAGAPGDGTTCSSGGCHGSGGPFGAELLISLSENGTEVTEYMPGQTYTLGVTINSTSGNPSRFGFQMTALVDSDNTNAGTITDVSSNAQSLVINERTYVEHAGSSSSESFSATWTAPATGTGDVKVYAAGIAANGNGGSSGDSGVLGSLTFAEADLSSVTLLTSDEMSFSPNPVKDFIFIDTKLNQNMDYTVLSINGVKVASGSVENNIIDIADLNIGLYIVTVKGDNVIYRQKIYKR